MITVKPLWIVAALALAACGNQSSTVGPEQTADAGSATRPPQGGATRGNNPQNAPYTGYPGAMDAGTAPTGDGGLAPPSTAMPAARPVYPDAGGPSTDGGMRR